MREDHWSVSASNLVDTKRTADHGAHCSPVISCGLSCGHDVEQDIIKLAVLEWHNGTGHIGLGFLRGYGLRKGAVASRVAHDSHNLIVAGTNDRDMALSFASLPVIPKLRLNSYGIVDVETHQAVPAIF